MSTIEGLTSLPYLDNMNPYMSKPKIDRQINIPIEIIKDLLTPSEWRMIKQRFLIIQLLERGLSIRKIAQRVRVGTDTVVRTVRKLESKPSLREFLKKDKQPSSKWIFGQIESEEN